jgi:hypothetical protein
VVNKVDAAMPEHVERAGRAIHRGIFSGEKLP